MRTISTDVAVIGAGCRAARRKDRVITEARPFCRQILRRPCAAPLGAVGKALTGLIFLSISLSNSSLEPMIWAG